MAVLLQGGREFLSAHHRGNGGRRGRDVARVGSVIEWRLVAGELLRLLEELRVIFDEPRAQVARAKVRVVENRAMVRDGCRRADQHELAQRSSGSPERLA